MKFQKTCVVLALSLLFAFGDQKSPSCANDVKQHLPSTETVTAVGSGVSLGTNTTAVVTAKGGAAVMKTLAAPIIGGVVAGAATGSVMNGFMGAEIVNNTLLKDDPNLPMSERDARSAGRTGSYVGAVGGAAATTAVVVSAGSAAGVASTLATIGGVVGGGMAVGAAALLAGPAVVAAGTGMAVYAVYRSVFR